MPSKIVRISWNDGDGSLGLHPDNDLPFNPSGPVDPGYGHGHPMPPGSIGTLPVFPFDPARPDNSLPNAPAKPSQPITLHPGLRLVVRWVACYGFVGVPDNELPETPEPK